MLDVLDLTCEDDIKKLRTFSKLTHPDTFRYFKNRVFEDAIKTHIVTLMYSTYGYAHIDKDDKTGRVYLGVCVMPEYQGKGIGKKLIEMLLKLHKEDIYLTVDKQNVAAISLYEKYKFVRIDETANSYTYKKSKQLLLEVSIGEAIDKLTILDIKLEKITNPDKRSQCKKEFDSISADLCQYLENTSRFYKWLKYINLQIWNLQDEIREKNNYSNDAFHKILDLNDMRFRVKMRINSLFETSFQEQKGYSSKTGIFLTHLGLGDLINLNGAIRYASLMVDKLYVICKQRNSRNIIEMLADDSSIHIVECKDDDSDVNDIISNRKVIKKSVIPVIKPIYEQCFPETITHRFTSGGWCGRRFVDDIPGNFYDDLKFDRQIKHIFAYFNSYNTLDIPNLPYIFTHGSSSCTLGLALENKWDIDSILTIDPNRNYYSLGHKWYSIAETYVNKPFLSYINVIENAKEIHVTDSSFYCIACFLPLKAQLKLCYDRHSGVISSQYNFT